MSDRKDSTLAIFYPFRVRFLYAMKRIGSGHVTDWNQCKCTPPGMLDALPWCLIINFLACYPIPHIVCSILLLNSKIGVSYSFTLQAHNTFSNNFVHRGLCKVSKNSLRSYFYCLKVLIIIIDKSGLNYINLISYKKIL